MVDVTLMLLILFSASWQDEKKVKNYRIRLAASQVVYRSSFYNAEDSILLINLHQNESTSVSAAKPIVDSLRKYIFVEIQSESSRNLSFMYNRKTYRVDPNRMFTEKGIKASLNSLNKTYPPVLVRRVLDHGRSVRSRFIDNRKLIVALHNNTDQNYSIRSYLPGAELEKDAEEVYVNEQMDEDDFFYTTSKHLYDALKARNYNIVLENRSTVVDDGSLSVLCGKLQIPYINIEAEHGHVEEQRRMWISLESVLVDKK